MEIDDKEQVHKCEKNSIIISLRPRSEQVSGSHVNEIMHDHSPVVIVDLDPRYY